MLCFRRGARMVLVSVDQAGISGITSAVSSWESASGSSCTALSAFRVVRGASLWSASVNTDWPSVADWVTCDAQQWGRRALTVHKVQGGGTVRFSGVELPR